MSSEAVFTEKDGVMGPYMLELTFTFSHSRLRSQLLSQLRRERGGAWKDSPIGWSHLNLVANFHNMFLCQYENEEYEEGGGKGWELTLCLGQPLYGAWALINPMPELTLTSRHSKTWTPVRGLSIWFRFCWNMFQAPLPLTSGVTCNKGP